MVGSQAAAFCYVNLTRQGPVTSQPVRCQAQLEHGSTSARYHVGHLGHLTVSGQLLCLNAECSEHRFKLVRRGCSKLYVLLFTIGSIKVTPDSHNRNLTEVYLHFR